MAATTTLISEKARTPEKAQIPQQAPARRDLGAKILIGLQLYAVLDYVLTTIAPYLVLYAIPGKPLGGEPQNGWIIEAVRAGGRANPLVWMFGVPGYYLTTLGGPIFALLALLAGATAASRWAELSGRTRGWLLGGAAVCVGLFFFGLTSLGQALAIWIAD